MSLINSPKNDLKLIKTQKSKSKVFNPIPKEILNNEELNEAIKLLPSNYNFEIYKSLWRIKRENAKRIALQFPEGLLIFSTIISDILEKFGSVDTLIMGDVTYGACCIDDFTAKSLGCDLMIHYGHSCLVPITITKMPTLYVFVEISFNKSHFVSTLKLNFDSSLKIMVAGTIQFIGEINNCYLDLKEYFSNVSVPQERPLSRGEVLGCTSPKLDSSAFDIIVFVSDGRFHLESMMISNPKISKFYKYNPYTLSLTTERYDFNKMITIRKKQITISKNAKKFGIILSTLGRQGSPSILKRVIDLLDQNNKIYFVFLFSEILPCNVEQVDPYVDAWIQIGCPRLSIDWGYSFKKPLLSSYECFVVLNKVKWDDNSYPMDYYSKNGGEWSNYYKNK